MRAAKKITTGVRRRPKHVFISHVTTSLRILKLLRICVCSPLENYSAGM